ncbi:DUF1510 family protein [Robertmurraya kyonggiensis]|uniref:DUF1510 family protein n=1 Tax=Robertmurraya kyonggiensis TaxID=1037680 RepID=A0A4U1DBM6_9BACI|nr:DUF1510 family protein [Robertmurraya kyonggiensis]TKC20001.1 DUF1510 family protein [Robertmurraya kyonggiensis]
MRIDNYGSRYHRRTKKKKTNIILNGLIGVVLLLIIVVSINIFFGGNDDERAEQNVEETKSESSKASDEKQDESSRVTEDEASEEETDTEQSSAVGSDENEEEADEEEADEEEVDENENGGESAEAVVTDGGSAPNVIKTIVNPAWKPVGTVQTGEHHNSYDGVDWDEMVNAISYATGLSEDQMTIQFLGNNGPNKSVGTVYTKGKAEIYRVYIEWVDGQGWKPTRVEQLSSIE